MAEPDNYDDELVSSNTTQRNWRGILIAVLVIVVVLALIVTSVVLLTPPDDGPRIKGQRVRLQDIVEGEYVPIRFNGTWVSGTELLYLNQWGEISLLNVTNLSERALMSNQTYRRLSPVHFSLSADRRFLLLAQNVQRLFRHSCLAQYSVYDIISCESFYLTPLPEDEGWPFLLHAQWTPRAHGLVMVHNYDVYFRPAPRSPQGYRITSSAVPGVLYNGVPDWLYEEEILMSNTALWMSNDGHLMLFASFNDSLVEEQRFPWFGVGAGDGIGGLYPEMRSLRYPKPGTPNPVTTLTVADLADPKSIRMRNLKPPNAFSNEEHYFTAASWISLTEVCVVWLNRPQNISLVTVCKSPMWYCQETSRVSGDGRGWVDNTHSPVFSLDGGSYIAVAPVRDGPAGHFKHLVHVHIAKKRVLPLTHGRFEVNRILHWDHSNNVIYYLGTPEGAPGQQHLYRASSTPPRVDAHLRSPSCLTCDAQTSGYAPTPLPYPARVPGDWEDEWERDEATTMLPTPPTRKRKKKYETPKGPPPCQYHYAFFSSGGYLVLECLGPGIPSVGLFKITAPHSRLQLVTHLQNNTSLQEKVAKLALPQVRTFPVQVSGGYHAQVRLHLPPGLREEEITRYPLVVHVYSGPGSQLVTDKWRIDWNTYLSGTKDYIVAQIDGRGSSGQGYQLLHEVYHRLGSVEVADQLEVTEYLRDSLHFVDKRRVGVWGWSYGGYVGALALASPQSLFQCGISVAPVTSWRLYDSTYTERYMGLPNVTANYKGYEEAELSRHAELLRDKQFFLVHGTADDNVHFQQSMVLARALASKGALFRQQVYPDEGHSLGGVKRHLYRSMGTFLEDCFRKQVPTEVRAGLRNGGSGSGGE